MRYDVNDLRANTAAALTKHGRSPSAAATVSSAKEAILTLALAGLKTGVIAHALRMDARAVASQKSASLRQLKLPKSRHHNASVSRPVTSKTEPVTRPADVGGDCGGLTGAALDELLNKFLPTNPAFDFALWAQQQVRARRPSSP